MESLTNRKQQRGMTLAEVLVAMAIFAIIFVAALMIYDRSNRVFKSGVESAELQQNTRVAFDKMLQEIRMAGHDYDRDGFPTAAGEAQQQDEQIEYAGPRALTFRANLDFDEPATDRGREATLEAPNSQFPIVTTGNDEIITYVLESQTGTNPDTVTFYADVTDGTVAKRQTFPGGQPEDKIDITGVDLCVGGCNNPPYTLLRVTVDDKGQPVRTPLANNIRSLEFEYFSDAAGSTALAIANAGGGQYNPASPGASAVPRAERGRIRAIGVTIIGMSEAPDPNFFDAAETLNAAPLDFTNYRKYRLETLVAARNLGKRGMREQQTAAPGPPVLDSVCFGYCGGVRLNWTAPPANPAFGSVESYVVLWDSNVGMTDPPINAQQVGLTTTFLLTGLDPNTTYRFTIAATNSWGTTYADPTIGFVEGKALNETTPDPPVNLVGTGDPTPLVGQIDLTWDLQGTNVSGQDSATCKTPAGATNSLVVPAEAAEMRGIQIWRSSDQNFNPLASPLPATTVLVGETTGSASSFTDLTAPSCITQYYRIRVVEYCIADEANQNVSPAVAYSAFEPAVGSPAIAAKSTSTATPAAPTSMSVLSSSSCAGGSCNVFLEWPEVKSDDAGNPLGIGIYDIDVTQDGSPYTTYNNVDLSSGLSISGGLVHYTVLNLPQTNLTTLVPYEYEFTARAVNCGTPGDWSPADKFPKCDFASGGTLQVSVAGALGGNGTLATPYELDSTGTITFTTSTSAPLQSVTAVGYVAADNTPLGWSDAATGPATTFNLGWPGGTDDTIYRVDYSITDSTGCETSGSIFIEDVQVGCPFTVPVTFGQKLSGNNVNPPHVELQLKNATALTIDVTKLEFTWSQAAAGTTKDVDIVSPVGVLFPTPPNNLTGATSYTGSFETPGTMVATAPGTTSNLAPSDQSGNYIIRVRFDVQTNADLGGNPITAATIHYRLLTDDPLAEDRTCTVHP
ncbi:MAG: PilW family protein [Thermoanaerobaculia bacterium]